LKNHIVSIFFQVVTDVKIAMPKLKKKKTAAAEQKVAIARLHNEFVKDLKTFLDKTVGPGIFCLIPRQEIEWIRMLRIQVKMKAAPGESIPADLMQCAKRITGRLMDRHPIKIGVGDLEDVPLRTFFSMASAVIAYAERLKEEDYSTAVRVKKALLPFVGMEKQGSTLHQALEGYLTHISMISMLCSDLGKSLYALSLDTNFSSGGIMGVEACMEFYARRTAVAHVNIDGGRRPVFRVAWFTNCINKPQMKEVNIPSELVQRPPGQLLGVYIQSHALMRLQERMDGVFTGVLHYHLYCSLQEPVIRRNRQGKLLFEYTLNEKKAGYFTGEVVGDKIVLTTFLFLTNNSTPEGEKLYNHTRITKADKKYLSLDKLSTFTNSDLAENERVKQLFIEAGCESLFNIEKGLCFMRVDGSLVETVTVADAVAKYLQLDGDPVPVSER
jgi:hypothetical protein